MFEIPLFPLSLVLFPGAPLYLHIFEERYKVMIDRCIKGNEPFGVVMIQAGFDAVEGQVLPGNVGCSALIMHVENLEQGRKNIIAVGQERFRILSIDWKRWPFLVGSVEPFPIANPNPEVVGELAEKLRLQIERFLRPLVLAEKAEFDFNRIPIEPVPLAYTAASLLQSSLEEKQELLALEQADDLLVRLHKLYRREIALLRDMLLVPEGGSIGAFSRN
jgi:Lon protease-like protein